MPGMLNAKIPGGTFPGFYHRISNFEQHYQLKRTLYMFTIQPDAGGYVYNDDRSQLTEHSVQQAPADSAQTKPSHNVTPTTDCISYLKQSAPQAGNAFHFSLRQGNKGQGKRK